MRLELAVVADAATLEPQSGKLNILGIFDNIWAKQFPATHPKLAFVCKISSHRAEAGTHPFKVSVVDADGRNIISPITGQILVDPQNLIAQIILESNNITFQSPGDYSFDIIIDNQHLGSAILHVLQV